MKFPKKLLAGILSVSMLASMSAFSAAALFDDDDTDSGVSNSVFEATTFTATVNRVVTGAMTVTPDPSAGLGTNLGVIWADASSFNIGDVVSITYSSDVTEANGMKSVTADSVSKVSSGASADAGNLLEEDDTPAETTAPANTTAAPANTTAATVSAANTTPATGDDGVMGFAMVSVVCGTACVAVFLSKKKGE